MLKQGLSRKSPAIVNVTRMVLCGICITWQPDYVDGRVDWNAHVWTMTSSLYQSLGAVDAVEWACVLCDHCIQNDWASRATNLHQIYIKFEHSSEEAIPVIQKATATGNWWLTASSQQCAHSCFMSHVEFFCKTSNHPGDLAPLQPRFGALWLLAFPKTKITFERDEISDHWWDSKKYD